MNWPIFITCFILSFALTKLVKKHRKHGTPERTVRQKQVDELITTVLPIISSKK